MARPRLRLSGVIGLPLCLINLRPGSSFPHGGPHFYESLGIPHRILGKRLPCRLFL